ncbi:MAG TPA: NAD(P)/FAD-dependent oxidoreductase [Terriglobales bacterium]|nr:NAD(P)/FAD-dependent oxidoreductase [Terriglobales bacterium]
MQTEKQHWAILGGGFLGMTLALRLSRQCKRVTLFESAPYLGGLASVWKLGDVVWDRHYHVTLLSDAHLRSLLRELGLEQEIEWVQTRTGFYTNSQHYSMSNALEFLRFPPLTLIDKLRLGATILYASRLRQWKTLEHISVSDWLRRWSGEHTFRTIWLPLLRAKLGENYKKASAAFIWAILARMYAARRAGMKKEMFGYVPGGYATVLAHLGTLLAKEGVTLRLGEPVRKVESISQGAVSVTLENGTKEVFDHAVLTLASPLAAHMCPDLSPEETRCLQNFEYQGIICASLLLKKQLSPYYITNITDAKVPFTALIDMSALVDRKYLGGHGLVYLPKYIPSNSPDFDLSDETIEEHFLKGLSIMYPQFQRGDLLAFRVSRVRYLLPIPTIGYSDHVPSISTSVPGLHILNSTQIVNGTLNVNETIQLAETAAARFARFPARAGVESTADECKQAHRQPVA